MSGFIIAYPAGYGIGKNSLGYDKFSSKYREIYGEEFAENYQAIIHA